MSSYIRVLYYIIPYIFRLLRIYCSCTTSVCFMLNLAAENCDELFHTSVLTKLYIYKGCVRTYVPMLF